MYKNALVIPRTSIGWRNICLHRLFAALIDRVNQFPCRKSIKKGEILTEKVLV